ncbi:putative copper homeostasis (lipo)protein LpqS [Nocardia thraciensis]
MGRTRFAVPLLILVAAVALVVPLLNCADALAATHTHTASPARQLTAPVEDTPVLGHCARHPVDMGCPTHFGHCVPDSMLPGDHGIAAPPRLITALVAAVPVPADVSLPSMARPRGPPTARLPVAGGRDILTHFCIARR